MEGVLHAAGLNDFAKRLRKLKGEDGGQICPVGLVDPEAQRIVGMEAEATDYGMPDKPSARLLSLFRHVRVARHEARQIVDALKEQKKK